MGVRFKVVGGAVMLIVLGHPPRSAQTNQEVNAEADGFILASGVKDSAMTSIMAHIPDLAKGESQKGRIEQLEPEIIYHHQES